MRAWLAERRKQIEVFHLPACCPELNPDEGRAADSRPGQRLMARLSTMWRLMPLAPQQTLVVDPALPDWLPEIVARHVQVGEEHADLHFWRDDAGCTQVEVLEAGNLKVVRPNDAGLRAGTDRMTARFRAASDPEAPVVLTG